MFNTDNIHRSSALLEIIVKNQFYNCAANGDTVLMAAFTRFICFCSQYDKASYCHLKAWKYENQFRKQDDSPSDADIHLQDFNIQDAFLGYNSCYDTLLQAIKFAFGLVNRIENERDFLDAIYKCKWNSTKDLIGLKEQLYKSYDNQNASFEKFFKLSSKFFEGGRQKVARYANNIKHNGGIIFPTLRTFIPSASRVNGEVYMTRFPDGKCCFVVPEGTKSFKMEWLYPLTIDSKTALQILDAQNRSIYDYVESLFETLHYAQLKSGKYVFPFESIKKNILYNDKQDK